MGHSTTALPHQVFLASFFASVGGVLVWLGYPSEGTILLTAAVAMGQRLIPAMKAPDAIPEPVKVPNA